jgi:hypothetical protein
MTRMWEAAAAPGRGEELLGWALAAAGPRAHVYRGADERVVVIDPDGGDPGEPPEDVVRRPPHRWDFQQVR